MEYDEFRVATIHGGLSGDVRDDIVKGLREGKYWVLICTELMGRGIDILGVGLVVNFDLPTSPISYIHRIGRTGRAGRDGRAVTFFTSEDKYRLRTIGGIMKQAGCEVPDYIMKLPKVNSKNRKKMGQSVPERALIRTNLKRKRDGKTEGGEKKFDGTFKRKKFDENDVGKERIRSYGKKGGDKVGGEVRTRYGKKDGKNSTKEAKPEYKIKPKKLGSKPDSKNKSETGKDKPQDRRKQKKELRKKKAGK